MCKVYDKYKLYDEQAGLKAMRLCYLGKQSTCVLVEIYLKMRLK